MADFLLGYPTVAVRGIGDLHQYFRNTNWGGYFQDDWKITPLDLTLNLGLRYRLQLSSERDREQDRQFLARSLRKQNNFGSGSQLSRAGLPARSQAHPIPELSSSETRTTSPRV